ncbi:MAG: hypothetical protein LBM96_13205 [Methanobrevibacter sp.]|jgi:hypothetical protein|nr:hypothetical protein [Candidatus Methanoflexus mossambicus]
MLNKKEEGYLKEEKMIADSLKNFDEEEDPLLKNVHIFFILTILYGMQCNNPNATLFKLNSIDVNISNEINTEITDLIDSILYNEDDFGDDVFKKYKNFIKKFNLDFRNTKKFYRKTTKLLNNEENYLNKLDNLIDKETDTDKKNILIKKFNEMNTKHNYLIQISSFNMLYVILYIIIELSGLIEDLLLFNELFIQLTNLDNDKIKEILKEEFKEDKETLSLIHNDLEALLSENLEKNFIYSDLIYNYLENKNQKLKNMDHNNFIKLYFYIFVTSYYTNPGIKEMKIILVLCHILTTKLLIINERISNENNKKVGFYDNCKF